MNLAVFILITLAMSSPVYAEIKLVCEDTSESAVMFRKQAPGLGIDIYALDTAQGKIKQLVGDLKDKPLLSLEITEAEIHFEQSGYINEPEITETFKTAISRVSGQWTRHAHYVDRNGQWLSGIALERIARSRGLWGGLGGVRQRIDTGECNVNNRKF